MTEPTLPGMRRDLAEHFLRIKARHAADIAAANDVGWLIHHLESAVQGMNEWMDEYTAVANQFYELKDGNLFADRDVQSALERARELRERGQQKR